MKIADFTTEPDGVATATLRRRTFLIGVSSLCAMFGFFGSAWALTVAKKEDFIWLSCVALVGFLPGVYAWTTGWVSRWKAAVFGFLLPVGVWAMLCTILELAVEIGRFWRA